MRIMNALAIPMGISSCMKWDAPSGKQFPSEFLVRYVDDSFVVITGRRDMSERIAAVRRAVQNQLTDGICSIRAGICYCQQELYDGAEALDKRGGRLPIWNDRGQSLFRCTIGK